ncbi:MAG: NAD(P)-dependent oxidoreductase [Armatimonadetes bacterium]|nr:NAD(P)-dependent oxidoreductase [Armatimonadota bacterium]
MRDAHEQQQVLLTGGGGLLGRALAPLLRERHAVTHFDLADPGDGLPWIRGSVRDPGAVAAACEGMDVVVHVAALHGRAWEEAGDDAGFQTNVLGTHNVLQGARKGGAWRVVFTSSIWATGHAPEPAPYLPIDEALPREPAELYGLTKKLGEALCRYASRSGGLSTLCLRPGGILPADAPPERRFGLLFGAVDVRDVAQAHLLAVEAPRELTHDTFIITAESPLCRVDPARFLGNRAEALEELLPGIRRWLAERRIGAEGFAEWYTIARARRVLGHAPQHAFRVPGGREE